MNIDLWAKAMVRRRVNPEQTRPTNWVDKPEKAQGGWRQRWDQTKWSHFKGLLFYPEPTGVKQSQNQTRSRLKFSYLDAGDTLWRSGFFFKFPWWLVYVSWLVSVISDQNWNIHQQNWVIFHFDFPHDARCPRECTSTIYFIITDKLWLVVITW